MSRMIAATGMALLSIGVVAPVQAQPVSGAGQVRLDNATTPAATDAARRKGPKVKVKEAMDTSRVASPPTTTEPVAPIAAPEAARTGRPKIKTKTASDTSRVASPPTTTAPVTAPIAPIAAPEAARTGRPKEKEKEATNDSVANPPATTEPVAPPTERRRKGPKERDDPVLDTSRTGRPKIRDKPASDTSRTGRPKERDDSPHNRSSLLLPALGGAAAIAAIIAATSGNDRPSSP